MTFKEILEPYLEGFGKPDQTHEFHLEKENYIQWYYYEEDVVVEFVCPKKNIKTGWEISFAFSLNPLKLYTESS